MDAGSGALQLETSKKALHNLGHRALAIYLVMQGLYSQKYNANCLPETVQHKQGLRSMPRAQDKLSFTFDPCGPMSFTAKLKRPVAAKASRTSTTKLACNVGISRRLS